MYRGSVDLRRTTAAVAGALLAVASLAQAPAPEPPERETAESVAGKSEPEIAFYDVVTVDQVAIVARIVDSHGAPIRGLVPRDLWVWVGDREVTVAALDWYSGGEPPEEERPAATPDLAVPALEVSMTAEELAPPAAPSATLATRGKLVVFFVQIGHHMVVTLDESYIGGHLKLLPHLRRLVAGLDPEDRVAIVSFDSRLKLWHDFTSCESHRDCEVIARTLYDAIGFGSPSFLRRSPGISLAEHFDFDAAKRAGNPERALEVLGDALAPVPGLKDLIFVGWGLGRYTHGVGVMMPAAYDSAVRSLASARASVFVLDVTQTPGHALAAGLRRIAAATGGTYASTYDFASRKVDQLARVLSGYYVISLDLGAFPDVRGRVQIDMRTGKGRVLYKPLRVE